MRGTLRHVAAFAILWVASACGTGDTKVDPADLELRDLLGVAPEVATTWDAEQRSSARRVLVDALDDQKGAPSETLDAYRSDDDLVRVLAIADAKRLDAGDDALGLVRIRGAQLSTLRGSRFTERAKELTSSEMVIDALASDSGLVDARGLVVVREPRLTVAAAYVEGTPPRLLVNTVVLSAFDEGGVSLESKRGGAVGGGGSGDDVAKPGAKAIAANGNPYSFYGSVAECAYAQRLRCEACLPSSSCTEAITSASGMDECTKLAENDGRGYFLLCINLALAITSVDQCTADAVPSCPRTTTAANDLGQIE
ncbi:MAG TPA: hypothetical protein VMZ53_20185, partial [Kofleriaceae bacterium]|nr:hypothetical protein [Kofleriaceae bacterium]